MEFELLQRLTRMEAQIERLVSNAESEKETRRRRNSEFDSKIVKLQEEIHGNGKEGLKIRVDRLEQLRKMGQWIIGLLGVGMIIDLLRMIFGV